MNHSSSSQLKNKTVLVVGLGLIGGSIAKGLKLAIPEIKLLACDQNTSSIHSAIKEGTIASSGDLETLIGQADIVILALPPLKISSLFSVLQSNLKEGAVVTDVGSVKSHLHKELLQTSKEFQRQFVLGHPIAGSERSGFDAANGNLFKGRKVILTPDANTNPSAVALINSLWRCLGANVLGMSIEKHDEVLAATSHLPHALAYAIVDVLSEQDSSDDIFRYAAGGFADFSRLASSNAQMWSDIFVANSEATEKVLGEYINHLTSLKEAIAQKDHQHLLSMFARSKQTRDSFIDQHYAPQKDMENNESQTQFNVAPGGVISGEIRVPGDKSISHRSIIFSAIANGVTKVTGFLEGEDALNTVAAFREMGVTIIGPDNGEITVFGVGRDGLSAPREPLYMGNSGTAMRLLAGLLAAQDFESELTGDESLNGRPMGRIADPLRLMGANINAESDGTPPLKISPAHLKGIHYDMPMASAQVKSCLLLAGLYAEGETTVSEPGICRDHTERMLTGFSYPVKTDSSGTVSISGGHQLQASVIDVPSDISSAAFFLVAAAITPNSDLTLRHVGVNPTRVGVIKILKLMGADITLSNEGLDGGEPVADIRIRHSQLRGIEIPEELIPLAIDEFPVLFIAAVCAEGETLLRGAEELRVKESDRIDAMAVGLKALGVDAEVFEDGIKLSKSTIQGGEVNSHGDHRIAMAFSIAALRATDSIIVKNCNNVSTSFPGFVDLARGVGLNIQSEEQ